MKIVLQSMMLATILIAGTSTIARADICGLPVTPRFTPAVAETPANIRAFHGGWGDQNSKWDGQGCTGLVVQEVSPDGTAKVLYVYGAYTPWGYKEPGSFETEAKIKDGALSFSAFERSWVYTLANDRLQGAIYTHGRKLQATLPKAANP